MHVVGILSWGDSTQENLNGAIASYLFNPILTYFCNNYNNAIVSFPKGYIGAFYSNITFYFAMVYGIKIEGVRINSLDATIVPAKFNQYDIITEIDGKRIGMFNTQYPFFTEIHLRTPGTSVNVRYLPYNSSTNTYATETSKTITLSTFNSSNDVFINNVHRQPYTV